jgi:hypothetical protein
MMKFSSVPDRNHRTKIFKGFVIAPVLLMLVLAMTKVLAETKIEMEETEITGARELPKVLYIVPWKKTRPGGDPLPMRSLIDEALSPIDVDVFKRQVRYYDMTRTPAGAEQ